LTIFLLHAINLQFEPVLQASTANHVHHMLIYKCRDLTGSPAANVSGPCYSVHPEAQACRGNLLIAGWAVGAGVRKLIVVCL